MHSGCVSLPAVLPTVDHRPETLYVTTEVNTLHVDGLACIPGLTQALYKLHPQPPNSVPRSPTSLQWWAWWIHARLPGARLGFTMLTTASEKSIAIDMLHKTPFQYCVRPSTTYFTIESLRVRLCVVKMSWMLSKNYTTYEIFNTTNDKNLHNIWQNIRQRI